MTIIIQRIQIKWAKASRESVMASRRNALFRAFSLPIVKTGPESEVYFHTLFYSDANSFSAPIKEEFHAPEILGEPHLRGIKLTFEDRLLSAKYRYTVWWTGHPEAHRTHIKRTLSAREGEYIRFEHNGRFVFVDSSASAWWYEHWIYNICVAPRIENDLFTCRKPNKQFLDMVSI